jgi:RNA recognition motif-containing protein
MNIFVAKLSSATTEEDLREVFGRFGEVARARVVTDRDTGESKGFGFVEMREAEAAKEAIETLNGFSLNGRSMVVKEAEDRRSGPGGPPRERPPRREGGFRDEQRGGDRRGSERGPERGQDRPPERRSDAGGPPPPSAPDGEGGERARPRFRDTDKERGKKDAASKKKRKGTLKPMKGSKKPKRGRWADDFDDDF